MAAPCVALAVDSATGLTVNYLLNRYVVFAKEAHSHHG